jgi:NAD-dependent DNA ligase
MNIKAIKRNPRAAAEAMTLGELRKALQHFDYEYHDQNASSIPDEVYDILRDVHDERSKKPYARVGSKSTHAARRKKLLVPMGSLSKLKPGSSGLSAFLEKGPFVVSDKEDGISLQLVYRNHELVQALQRGDGKIGTDSSGVIPALNVPKRIKEKDLIVRVEFTMGKATFSKHFDKASGGEFENARNGAGGLLNRNQPNPVISKIKCIAHEIMEGKNARVAPSKQFAFLKTLGFDVVPHKVYPKLTEKVLTNLLSLRKSRSRREIDGIVVAQDRSYTVSGKYPTHAVAFKINDLESSVLVTVKDVEWNESRYGRLAPRVIIEPTRIGGVTVTHFTGHNGFYIEHGYTSKVKSPPYAPRPIGKGAVIRAVRSGDVIPYIVEVVKPAKKPSQPSIEFESDGVHYYASTGGDDRKAKLLLNFFNALEVDGVKRGTIDVLIENGFDTIKKIITARAADFEQIPRFGHTKAVTVERNIRDALAKRATLPKLAAGSALFGDKFGESRLRDLFDAVPNIVYSDLSKRELVDSIQQVRGFKALAVPAAEAIPKFRLFLKKLGIKVVSEQKVAVIAGGKMAGKSVLFTSVRDKQLQEWIIAQGGKMASTVKSANLLIVKDQFASNNKTEYAQQNGIPIMTLDQFRTKYKVS